MLCPASIMSYINPVATTLAQAITSGEECASCFLHRGQEQILPPKFVLYKKSQKM